MFKGLFSWWKEDVLLQDAFRESGDAISKAGEMFSLAMDALVDGASAEDRVYAMDRDLNEVQVDIRKKVLEHLAINPEQDITASLILITIIIDVERAGDFAKNILELREISQQGLDEPAYAETLAAIRQRLDRSFSGTKEAFLEGEEEIAKRVMDDCTWISNKCDAALPLVACDEDLGVRTAVSYGLLFRYLKRTSLHLRNIASSVVNPFHKVGYRPE